MPMARSLTLLLMIMLLPVVFSAVPDNATFVPYETDAPEVEQDMPQEPLGSAQGEVFFIDEGGEQGVYVRLGDAGTLSYTATFSEAQQGPVVIDEPVRWTIEGMVNATQNVTVNLWNHNDSIAESLLADAINMSILLNGEEISEVPIFSLPTGAHDIVIELTTPPVREEIVCEKRSIQDLLPPGARIITSDLPVDTVVQEVCRIRLYHESHTPYADVQISIDEIPQERIKSIYSVEQERYVLLENDTAVLRR